MAYMVAMRAPPTNAGERPPAPRPSPALVKRVTEVVGPKGVITDAADMDAYLADTRGLYRGASPLVVRPATTQEVAAVLRLCAEDGVPIVPQGGNTGLSGGAVAAGEVLLNLGRMNRVRTVDPLDHSITVEAGAVLADIQRVAEERDRLFPLSLGAEGSCQIGGNLSTNAGGTAVLRYGSMRELTLGLEVVLPDGRVWDGLRGLRKDNTGYDLKHLFIGAEGTLGVITAAVLKLFPRPGLRHTALVGLDEPDQALELLARARAASADALTAFELFSRRCLDFALDYVDGTIDPLDGKFAWYALIEFSAGTGVTGLGDALESILADALEAGLISDAAIAQSEAQRSQMWFVREALVEAQRHAGASIKNDVAVPVSKVPQFIREAGAAVEALCPGIRPVAFGHAGDGNIHFNLTQPEVMDRQAFLDRWWELAGRVDEIAHEMNGSFSAEHGVGLLKRREMLRFKSPVELDLMRRLKAALDPGNLMNPGKVL